MRSTRAPARPCSANSSVAARRRRALVASASRGRGWLWRAGAGRACGLTGSPCQRTVRVEESAGRPVRTDLRHPDDDLRTLLDGLGARVVVQVGGGVAGLDGVDPDAGER